MPAKQKASVLWSPQPCVDETRAVRSRQEDVGEVPVLGTKNATRGGFALSGLRSWRRLGEKYSRFEGPRDLFGGSHKCVHKMGPKNEPKKRVTVQIQYKSCY